MGRLKQNTDANRQTLHYFLLGTFFCRYIYRLQMKWILVLTVGQRLH